MVEDLSVHSCQVIASQTKSSWLWRPSSWLTTFKVDISDSESEKWLEWKDLENLDRAKDRDALENWPDFDVLQQGAFGMEVQWDPVLPHSE